MADEGDQRNGAVGGNRAGNSRFFLSDDQFSQLMARVTSTIENASSSARAAAAVTAPVFADHNS